MSDLDVALILPKRIVLAFANALDEAEEGLLAAAHDRQPTKLGRDNQGQRLCVVRSAKKILEVALENPAFIYSIPDEKSMDVPQLRDQVFAKGWNACREVMLKSREACHD